MSRFGVHGALFLLLTAACAEDGTLGVRDDEAGLRTVELGDEFTLAVNEMVLVEGTHLLVFFEGVGEDSRCPTDVQCPWQGNAAARLELSSEIAEFAPQLRVLNTGFEPRETSFMGVVLRLVDVVPQPRASAPPIDPQSYTVKLVATR